MPTTTPLPADVLLIIAGYGAICREELACTAPVEISHDQWRDALEILPPDCWEQRGPFQSFQCSERITGRVAATYLRRSQRYWSFHGIHGMGIDAVIETVRRHLAATT